MSPLTRRRTLPSASVITALSIVAKSRQARAAMPMRLAVLTDIGRKIHGMFLFEVKRPEDSRYPWDYHRPLADTPAEQAFRPESEGGCNMVKS